MGEGRETERRELLNKEQRTKLAQVLNNSEYI